VSLVNTIVVGFLGKRCFGPTFRALL
jgi:hypothetical protein